jgi:hypothetical protein
LPFFSIYLPPEFRKTERGALMYNNLKTNVERLSTPFDIHATLTDILKPPSVEELSTVQTTGKRSLSLFKEIPVARTCEQVCFFDVYSNFIYQFRLEFFLIGALVLHGNQLMTPNKNARFRICSPRPLFKQSIPIRSRKENCAHR